MTTTGRPERHVRHGAPWWTGRAPYHRTAGLRRRGTAARLAAVATLATAFGAVGGIGAGAQAGTTSPDDAAEVRLVAPPEGGTLELAPGPAALGTGPATDATELRLTEALDAARAAIRAADDALATVTGAGPVAPNPVPGPPAAAPTSADERPGLPAPGPPSGSLTEGPTWADHLVDLTAPTPLRLVQDVAAGPADLPPGVAGSLPAEEPDLPAGPVVEPGGGLVPADVPLAALAADLSHARSALDGLVVRAAIPTVDVTTDPVERAILGDVAVADVTLVRDLEQAASHVFTLALQAQRAVTAATQAAAAPHALLDLEDAVNRALGDGSAGTAAAEPSGPESSGAVSTDRWPNGAIPLGELCSPDVAPTVGLRCDAAAALDRLAVAYEAGTGQDFRVNSGYRSYDRQAAVRRVVGGLAAAPGRSNHGRGIAVDLADMGGLGQFDAPGYLWMRAHAAEFGWHHPLVMRPGGGGPQEPWHWEFGTARGYDDRGHGAAPRTQDRKPVPSPVASGPEPSGAPIPAAVPEALPPAGPAPIDLPGPAPVPPQGPGPTEPPQGPPVEPAPPTEVAPPVEVAPPAEVAPPVEVVPPVEVAPPAEVAPPVEVVPPVEESAPAEVPPPGP